MKFYLSILLFFLAGTLMSKRAIAQCDPVLANESLQYIVDSGIYATAVKGNTLYIGGDFNFVGRNTGRFIGVDTLTGQPIHRGTWPKVNSNVYKAIADGAGGWYIGGSFTKVGDSVRNNIAQINNAGIVTAWNPSISDTVYTLLLVNNNLYAGGAFTHVGGTTRNRIAAINTISGITTSWNPNANNTVNELETNNGLIYVGGQFTNIGSATRSLIAALDTTIGHATAWNPECYGTSVLAIAFNGANVYVGGNYTIIGRTSRNNLGAIDSIDGLATGWTPIVNGAVNKIVMNTSTMYIGGAFTHVGSFWRHSLAEVSIIADTATNFDPMYYAFGTNVTYDILLNANKMYVGGDYYFFDIAQPNLVQINLNTDSITSWQSYSGKSIYTLGMYNGIVYAGGQFRTIGAYSRTRLAAIDMVADTLTNWAPQAGGRVMAIATSPNAIYVGGSFHYVNSVTANLMAAFDTASGGVLPGFSASISPYSYWVSNLIYKSGLVYVGGNYQNLSIYPYRTSLAAVDATTGAWNSWNPSCLNGGSPGEIQNMLSDGTNLYITGLFDHLATAVCNLHGSVNIATGTFGTWNPPTDGMPEALALYNGNMYCGGSFNHFGSLFTPRLSSTNLAIDVESSWQPYPSSDVTLIKPHFNHLYLAGSFTSIHGTPLNGFAIVDTASNIPLSWNPAPLGTVRAIEFSGNKMFVAGNISNMSGQDNFLNLAKYTINTLPDTIRISGADTICGSTATTYTASTGITGATLQWKVNSINRGSGTSTFSYTPLNGDHITCTVHAPSGYCYSPDSAISNTINVVVNPYVTIYGPTTVCAGTAISDTALTSTTGITYQWRVNGVNTGTDSIYSYTPVSGDHITCTIHGVTGCSGTDSVTSSIVTMSVNPLVSVLHALTANLDTLCIGQSVSCNASSFVSGLHYAWKVNGIYEGTDDSAYSYIPANGDIVKVIVTAPLGGCYINNPDSGAITITVNNLSTPAISISGDSILCIGITGTYIVSPIITGAHYLWSVNHIATTDTVTSYSYLPTAGDQINCILILPTTACYSTLPDTSRTLVVSVNPIGTPEIFIATISDTVCAGTYTNFNAITPGITGATYQWKVNGTNVGTSTSAYNYLPTNGDSVNCIITLPHGACFTDSVAPSNKIGITVISLTTPTITLSGPGFANQGNMVTIAATVANVGSSYLITWYNNGIVFNTSTAPTTTYIKGVGTDNITAKIISLSPGCFDTTLASAVIVTEAAAGVNLITSNASINVYPNPFDKEFTIKGLHETDNVTIFDFTGRQIYDFEIKNNNQDQILRFNSLAKGLYLLHIVGVDGYTIGNITICKK